MTDPGRIIHIEPDVDEVPLVRTRLEFQNAKPPYDLLIVGDKLTEGGRVVHMKLHTPANVTDYMTAYHYLAKAWRSQHAQGQG